MRGATLSINFKFCPFLRVDLGGTVPSRRRRLRQAEGLFQQLFEEFFENDHGDLNTCFLCPLAGFFPDGIIAARGVKKLVAFPGEAEDDSGLGLAVAIGHDLAVDQSGLEEEGRVVNLLLLGVVGKAEGRLFAFCLEK